MWTRTSALLFLALAFTACSASDTPGTSQGECGDGVVQSGEACDDGNSSSRDGCTDACEIADGFVCDGEPSVCTPESGGTERVCGDGILSIGEGCDDGNTSADDGCSPICGIEPGFSCVGSPSVCTPEGGGTDPVCGDGLLGAGEVCDDGNSDGGDGCSAACTVEPGFTCEGEPSVCTPVGGGDPVCGDGAVGAGEACDDGNLTSGDGCSNLCVVEAGFTCEGEPSVCVRGEGLCAGVVCSDDPCQREACNPDNGLCEVVETLEEGARCNDGNLCTAFDTCRSGVCVGDALECPGSGGPCGGVACNPDTGACEARGDVPDGTPCDTDTNECTSEVCAAGECVLSVAPDCTPCGADSYCGGGFCGGVPPEQTLTFDGSVPSGFTMGGAAPWLIDSAAGRSGGALRSGDIGDSESSSATYAFESTTAGTLSFWYRVDSESCCDDLTVTLDGATLVDGSAASAWTEVTAPVAPGSHTLVFTYTKDISISSGADSAFIDDLRVPGGETCDAGLCGVEVSNGTTCVVCEAFEDGTTCDGTPGDCTTGICSGAAGPVGACVDEPIPDGSSCDADPDDCREQVCEAGACVDATVFDDCTACGPGGAGLCAGGTCGGLPSDTAWNFDDGAVPADFGSAGSTAWRLDNSRAHSGAWSARSGDIGDNGLTVAEVEVTLTAAGEVRFFYQMQSESCCDDFNFLVDGAVVFTDAGTVDTWTEVIVPLSAGSHTLAWVYDKDSSFSSGYDGVFVDTITVSGTERCEAGDMCGVEVWNGSSCIACPLLEDGSSCDSDPVDCLVETCGAGRCVATGVDTCTPCGDGTDYCVGGECGGVSESTNFRFGAAGAVPAGFTMSGNQPWFVQAGAGRTGGALRSGDIGDSQDSIATYTFSVTRPTDLTFWYRVSSEAGWDFLTVTIDGVQLVRSAGNVDWTEVMAPIAPGTHTLVFNYDKDGSSSVGDDAAFIDDLTFGGGDSCTGDTECAPELYDGAGCVACPVPDGTPCAGGTCGAGVCEAP